LTIKSYVTEELTWFNLTNVVIQYVAQIDLVQNIEVEDQDKSEIDV